jgi:hypothetical protein
MDADGLRLGDADGLGLQENDWDSLLLADRDGLADGLAEADRLGE